MKKGLTELVFILDRSGSMAGLEADTIGGYNSMLEKQKKEEGEALISTVLFDTEISLIHDRADIKNAEPMTDKVYYTKGCTALLDAVGGAIKHIGKKQKEMPEEERPEKTLFIITTDGMENSSRLYSYSKVKKMVEKKKNKKGWEFIFLGANIDAIEVADRFGVSADRAATFHCDGFGTELNFSAMSNMITGVRKASSRAMMGCALKAMKSEVEEDFAAYSECEEAGSAMPELGDDIALKVESHLNDLTERERKLAELIYGLNGNAPHTYEEAAGKLNLNSARARQIDARVRKKVSA